MDIEGKVRKILGYTLIVLMMAFPVTDFVTEQSMMTNTRVGT